MRTPAATQADTIDALLTAHGLRRTRAARAVLQWMGSHADQSWSHSQLQAALTVSGLPVPDRVTLYRLLDKLSQSGLLLCTVDAERVRHYRAVGKEAEAQTMPRFECQACHRAFGLQGTGASFEKAARSALKALRSIGHQGLSVDLAVRGVCVDCSPAAGHA
ncbi:MAG: Fur family transcriptional regulator [Polaromonas sp.]